MELEHTSHSAIEEYKRCPHRFYLHRVKRVEQEELLAGPAGTAFHTMTEQYDLGNHVGNFEDYLYDALDGDTTYKVIRDEDRDWWISRGAEMFERYVTWRKQTGWEVVGVEEQFSVKPDGLEVPFLGYIDRRFRMSSGKIVVLDIKTGLRIPRDDIQLKEYYAAARIDGKEADAVAYYSARGGFSTGLIWPIDWNEKKLVEHVRPVEQAILADEFPPNASVKNCQRCPVSQHCEFRKESKSNA